MWWVGIAIGHVHVWLIKGVGWVDKRGGTGEGLEGMMGETMGKVSKGMDARKGEGMTADVECRQVVVKKGES